MKLVVQSAARIWGGNEKWLSMVAAGLRDRGHEVVVACRRDAPVDARMAELGIPRVHVHIGGDADLVRAFRFASMLSRKAPDVLLLSDFKKSFWGGWAARRAGVPRVVERMGMDQGLPDRWKYRHAFRHYIDGLIVNSRDIRDRWLASAPWFPPHEVHIVLNGVRRPDTVAGRLRSELGIETDMPLVLGAGRLERRKGFDVLVDAFARVDVDARLAVAGTGPEAGALRAQARELGVHDRVHWLGFRDDLPALLVDGDVFALPSRTEGMANVMLEAMAADLLVVATDISGVREALAAEEGRGPAGWIVPRDDPGAMARALTEALEGLRDGGSDAMIRLRETRRRVDERFDPARTVEETERALLGR